MAYEQLKQEGELELRDRHSQWTAERNRVDRLVDGRGHPIDEGIKESVVGLRILGLKTSGSCEGHPDWGMQTPWIDFETSVNDEMRAKWRKSRQEHNQDDLLRLLREIKGLVAKDWNKVVPLLDEFYRERAVPYYQRLVLVLSGETTRLISQGGETQIGESSGRARERLEAYRLEMNAFTRFLRERFLKGS